MSTIYMSQLSTLPLMDGDQDQGHFQAFHLPKYPPILFPFMIDNPVEHQGQGYGEQHSGHQLFGESNQQFNDHMTMDGRSVAMCSPFRPTIQSIGTDMIQRSSYNSYDMEATHAGVGSTSQWAPSKPPVKMRIMRKALTNDPEGGTARKPRRRAQAQQATDGSQQLQHAMGVIRVCSDCNTTKTPLWRSGPCGPKSLCNACGIRQRKARRTMAATVAAAANGGVAVSACNGGMTVGGAQTSDTSQATMPTKKDKIKRAADVDRSLPFKKRCKIVDHPIVSSTKAVEVDAIPKDHDHVVAEDVEAVQRLSKTDLPAAFIHGSVRDEITDAALMLMTLSCGLVRS